MTNFEKAFTKLIYNEGGYVNDKDDAGGETYMGITRKNHNNKIIWDAVDKIKEKYTNNKAITNELKKNKVITDEVRKIYKTEYWDVLNLDDVKSYKLAFQLFDSSVNVGVTRTRILYNNVLKRLR